MHKDWLKHTHRKIGHTFITVLDSGNAWMSLNFLERRLRATTLTIRWQIKGQALHCPNRGSVWSLKTQCLSFVLDQTCSNTAKSTTNPCLCTYNHPRYDLADLAEGPLMKKWSGKTAMLSGSHYLSVKKPIGFVLEALALCVLRLTNISPTHIFNNWTITTNQVSGCGDNTNKYQQGLHSNPTKMFGHLIGHWLLLHCTLEKCIL